MLKPVNGRKAIVVVSDGLDNRSKRTLNDLLAFVGEQGVSIYTIGLGDPAKSTDEDAGFDEAALRAIADGSGGMYTFTPKPDDLRGLYELLSVRIQNEYRLTYTSPNALRDGTIRTIAVQVNTSAGPTAATARYNPGGVIPQVESRPTWCLFCPGFLVLAFLLVLPTLVGLGRRLVTRQPKAAAPAAALPKPRIRLTEPAEKGAKEGTEAKEEKGAREGKPRAKRTRQK